MEKTCNIISDSDFRSKIIDYIKSKYADADNDTSNISGAVLTLTANNVFDVYLDNHKDDLNRINNNEDIFEGMSDKQKDIMLDDIKKIIDSNFLNVPGMERRFTFGTEGRPGYTFEVSSAGDDLGKKFSALNALLGDKSIEFIYQNEVKKRGNNKNPSEDSILNIKKIAEVALYIKDNMGKTLKTEQDALDYIDKELGEVYRKYDTGEKDFKPTTYLSEKLLDILLGKEDIEELGNKFNYENISYYIGYFPLWKKWASEHKDDIEELRKAAKGKVITDKFATNSSVSQARALAFILNESLSKNTAFDVDRKYSGYYTFNPSIGNKGKVSVTVVNNGKDFYSNWGVIAKKYGLNVKDENFSEYRKPESETITESRKGAIYSLYHKLVRNGRISSTSRSFKTFEQYMKLFLDHKNIFIGGILGKTNVNFTNEKDDKGESKLIKIDAGSDLNPTVLELATAYAALNGNNVYMFDTRTKSWYKYEQGENRKIGEFKVVNDSPYFQADSLLIGDLSKRLSNKSIEKLNDFFQGAEGKKDNVVNDYIKLEEDRRKRELELKEASDDEFANEVKDKENESEKVLESLSKENVEYSELLKTMNPYQIAERVHNLVRDFGDTLSTKMKEKIEELKDLIQTEKEAGHTSLALSYENILSKIEDYMNPKCRKYFMKSFNYSPLKVFEDTREWYKTYLNLSTEDRLEDCKGLLNLYSFSSNTQLDKKAKEVDSYRRATYPGIIANFGILMKLSAPELKVMEQMKIDVVNGNLGVEDKEDKSKEESDINSNERDIQEDSLSLASAGWMIDFREVDPYSTLSTKVRMIINTIPLLNNKGNIILDNYGRVVHANSGVVYNTLLNKMRFVTTEKEFMDMLKSMKEFTWADSLYKYLNIDKNCNERNLFYHNFRREFTTMYVMKTSTDNYGIESTELVPINETSGKGSLLGEVKDNVLSGTPSNNCKYPIYSLKEVAAKKNKPGLKVGSVNVKNVGLFHAKVLAVTSKIDRLGVSSIVENRENILTDIRDLFDRLGFNVSTDTIKSMFLDPDKAEDSYKKMKTAFNKVTEKYAERSLDTQRKKEFKYYGGVLSVYGTYALLGKLLDESVEVDLQNSAYQNGKVYQSFTNPSYLGITINALKNALNPNNEKRFNDFIKEHYTRFKWFAEPAKDKDGNQILDNNGDPVTQYYCKWLGLLVKGGLANTTMENKEFFREGLDFCTIIERDGKKYTEWTDTETALSNINMFRNAKGGFGYYAVPVLADSPAAYYIRFVKYTYDQLVEDKKSVYYGQKKFIRETVSGLADVMLQEYNRITTVKKRLGLKNIKKIKVFDSETGGAIFRFFPELNDFSKVEQIFGNDSFFKDIIAEEKREGKEQASFYRIISRLAANDKDSAYEYINKAALTLMEYRYNNYINSKEAMKLKERSMAGEKTLGYKYFKNIKVAEDDQWLNEELQVYFYNHELAQTQIIELLGTDLAYYKNLNDFCKRWKEVYSSMSRLNTDAMYKYKNEEPVRVGRKYQRVVYIKTLKDISSSIPQIMNILDRKVKEGHITEGQKKDILKAYANIDVTDGQAYRCLSSYRAIKVMEGGDSWTDDMEEAYRRIKNGTWTMSDFDFTFNTFKPYTYSEYAVKSGFDNSLIKVHTQHKDSEILLTMFGSILSGDKNSGNSIQDSTLAALNDFMENGFRDNEEDQNNLGGVDLAVFDSGVKVGEQGVIDINYKNTIKEEHRKKFGLKENASYDNLLKAAGDYLIENLTGNIEKDKQLNKEIEDILKDKEYSYTYDDMLDHLYKETGIDRKTGKDITDDDNVRLGEDVVHILPFSDYGIQMATPDHSFDAEQMIGSQIVKLNTADIADNALIHVMSPNKSTNTYMNKNDYISLYHKCIVEPKIQSYLKLMKDFSNSRSISGRVVSNMYADSRYSHDMVRAASVNSKGEFIYPWYEASHTDRLQNVCNSMVKKSIIKKKMFGGSAFQATAYKSDKLKIVWKKDYGYVKEGGKYDKEDKLLAVDYIPCMMPFYSKRYFDLFKDPETGQIDISKVPQELLRAIGYRIPTEDKYSMLPLKIVGFLPKEYGSAIILPKEITTITGSDFDIDKIFLMMRRFEYNPGFNIKTYIKEQKKDKKKYLYKKASDMYEKENPELGDESYFSDTYKEAKGKVFKKYSRQSIINNYIIKHTEKNADFKDVDLKGYLGGKSVVLTDSQGRLLAPNGKVSNLNERQYAQVRTKEFKDWFGDWESVAPKAENSNDTVGGSPVALSYLLEGGPMTIESTGYLLHGISAAFELITNKIEAIRSKYLIQIDNNPSNFKNDTTGALQEIKNIIDKTYGQQGLNILEDILNNATGFYSREGVKIQNRLDKLNTIIRNAQSRNVSKVVDENGEPLVVYHGTNVNIDSFNYEDGRENNTGFYFTSDIEYAKDISRNKGGNTIIPVFLNIKHPITDNEMMSKSMEGTYVLSGDRYADGVIGHDKYTGEYIKSKGFEYIVLQPKQVKSATDNTGTFSRTNDDIYDKLTDIEKRQTLTKEEQILNKSHRDKQKITLERLTGKANRFVDNLIRRTFINISMDNLKQESPDKDKNTLRKEAEEEYRTYLVDRSNLINDYVHTNLKLVSAAYADKDSEEYKQAVESFEKLKEYRKEHNLSYKEVEESIVPIDYNEENKPIGDIDLTSLDEHQLNNMLFDLIYSNLTSPDCVSKFIDPQGFDNLKKVGHIKRLITSLDFKELSECYDRIKGSAKDKLKRDTIYSQFSKIKDSAIESAVNIFTSIEDPVSPNTYVFYHNQNMRGKNMLPVYANHNVNHANVQNTNLRIKSRISFKFGDHQYPLRSLHNITDDKGRFISKTLASFIGASADTAKDPILADLYQSYSTVNMTCTLIRLGYDPAEITMLFSHPLVQSMINDMEENPFKDKRVIIYEYGAKLGLEKEDKSKVNYDVYTNDYFADSIFKYKDTDFRKIDPENTGIAPKEISELKGLCVLMDKIAQVSDDVTVITSNTRQDTTKGGIKPSLSEVRVMAVRANKINNAVDSLHSTLTNVPENEDGNRDYIPKSIFNTQILGEIGWNNKPDADKIARLREELYNSELSIPQSSYTLSIEGLNYLYGNLFLSDSPIINTIFSTLEDTFDIEKFSGKTFSKLMRHFQKYWLTQTKMFGIEDSDYTDTFRDFAFDRTMKLPESINSVQEAKRTWYIKIFPSKFKAYMDEHKDLIEKFEVLKVLYNNTNSDRFDGYSESIRFRDVGRVRKERQDFYTNELTILLHSDNKELVDLAKNLYIYGIFKYGFDFNPNGYVNLFPIDVNMNDSNYMAVLRTLEKSGNYHGMDEVYNFIDQWVCNNFTNRELSLQAPPKAVATYMNGSSDKKIITISKNNFQKDFGGIPSQFITFKVGSSYRVYRYNGDVHNLSMVNNLDYYQLKTLSNEYEYGKAILEMTNVHSKRLTEETAKELDPSFKVNDKNAATLATILDNQSKKSDEIEKQESEEDVKNPKADKETVENSSSNSRGFSLADFDVDKAIERDEARERKPEEGASLKTLVGWFGKKDDTQASMGDNSDTDINEDLNNFLLAMLKKNGVGIGSLNELDERLKLNGVTDFSATKVDGILQTIRLAKGKRGQRALPEEFAHWAMRVLLDNNDPLAIRIKNYILSHELSSEIIGNEYDNYTQEYANDNDKLAEEAAGKLLAEALNERFKEEHSPWYVRMFKIISRLLKRFKQFFGNADNKSIEEMVEELRGQNSLMAKNILRGTYNDTLSKGYKISNTRLMQIESEVKTIKQALNRVQDRELKLFNVYKKDVDNDSDNKKYLDLISNLAKNIKKGDYKKGIIDYISDGIDNLRSFNTILKTLNTNRNIKYNAKFSFLRSVRNFTDSYGKTINDLRSALRNDSSVEDDFTKSVTSIINEMGSLISEIDNMWKEQAINQCSFMLRGYFGADIITKINSLNDTKYKSVSDILRNAESDISFLDTFMDSMAASNDFILKAADQIVKKRKEEDRLESVADSKDIIAMGIKLRQAGVNNFDFLYEKDKDGKFTGNYISKYNYGKYEKDMNEFAEYIKDKYKDKSLSKDDMSKEIADWRAVHTNGFNEPADSYINDDFKRLEAEGGPKYEFYKSFMDKFEELKKILPTYAMGKISPNMAVQIRKDLLERLMASKSAKEAGAQAWQNIVDQLLVREDDTMFGELEEGEKGYVRYKMQDFDGTEFHTVPIHFNRRIKNADRDMSRDAVSTLIAFSNMAHNFRGMSNIANSMEVLKTILSERKPHEKVGKNKIYSSFTVFGKTVTSRMISEENNISKKFNNFLLSQVYGMYSTEGLSLDMPFMKNSRVSVTKLTESLSRVNSICVLGVNMLSGFASMASDITQINSEAVAGQFFNKKQLLKADSIYSKELITSLGEVGSRVKTGKLNLFIELFNVLQDHDIDAANAQFDKNKFQKFMSLNSLFFFQHLGDHWGQCRTALAMALNTKMKDKAGNETNLWDALEVEYLDKNNPELGARLKLKDGIEMQAEKLTRKQIKEGYTGKYKKVEESDLIKFSNKIRGLNDTLFGIYNKKDMSVMQRYAIGRLIIMYKKYLVTALERRFAKKDYNMDLDVMTEGYYRSMYNFTKQLIIDLRNGKMDIVRNWKNMDDTTYYNMLRGMTELSTFAVLSLALVLLGGMGKGEAKKKSWQIQLGMYLTYRLNYELSALVPSPTMLNDLVGMLKNPLAIMQTIERTSNMLKLFYPTSWIGEDSTVKQGFMKGYKKGLKILTLSPFGSVISTVYKGSHPMSFVGMYK